MISVVPPVPTEPRPDTHLSPSQYLTPHAKTASVAPKDPYDARPSEAWIATKSLFTYRVHRALDLVAAQHFPQVLARLIDFVRLAKWQAVVIIGQPGLC